MVVPRAVMRASLARTAGALLAGCGVLAVTACGSAAAGSSRAPAYEVRATAIKGLGTILADGAGMTLYMYVPDDQGSSVCFLACATNWPPLLLPKSVTRPVAGPGIDPALLGTVRRPGGALQVTYGKWPLYLYREDLAPGQATGQAESMGLWWVLSVSGAVDRGVVAGTGTRNLAVLRPGSSARPIPPPRRGVPEPIRALAAAACPAHPGPCRTRRNGPSRQDEPLRLQW